MMRRGRTATVPMAPVCLPIGAIDVEKSLMRRASIAVLLLTELFEN